ncbi:hypothetical protein EN858_29920 [Mesorhizobium sp. M4B.F.Ca.ET.215.01.1.1]|uniref:hypothetical protein n=1 Tax=unclassified Mesorhizobium TaxID=325217 RepID=UPI000FE4A6D3|nr:MULTISPECIES: hypothetical protein [unclassified Mesorhizobium]RWC82917.1 MAG: hypothetical protein EOS31_14260 [Mesorhizobium sp.]TGQ05232.1 hypothetical protein EN858_29920 [Mesorhizobium sp. M4B.F.Ca.ET.215.01.1.1]TGQ30537.1 hypothetical protein EN863_040770 [Mesorhizobium sp. M00.F.Ca.ET.220.01.1.1]TGQ97778.1 hypothetical protein EN846_28160 [Mesorhizobium sp. M4B.F.Ca.ET.203.01.1.1]TIV38412.1 MAG: hypothetical protein E5V91_14805 [Mesorhizobium sp.]
MDFDDEEVDERSCGGMAEFCCRYKDSLNDREAGFDQQMKARTTLGGRISPKQQAWLEIILWKTEPPKSLRCLAWILAEQREFRLCHLAYGVRILSARLRSSSAARTRDLRDAPASVFSGEIRISEAILPPSPETCHLFGSPRTTEAGAGNGPAA